MPVGMGSPHIRIENVVVGGNLSCRMATQGSLLDRLAGRTQEAEVYESRSDTIEVTFNVRPGQGCPRARELGRRACARSRTASSALPLASDQDAGGAGRSSSRTCSTRSTVGDPGGLLVPEEARARSRRRDASRSTTSSTARLTPQDLVALGEKRGRGDPARGTPTWRSTSTSAARSSEVGSRTRAARPSTEKATSVSISIEFNRTRDSDVLLDDDGFSGVGEDDQLDRAIARAIEKLDRAKTDVKLEKTGMLPVYFSPGGSFLVLSALVPGPLGEGRPDRAPARSARSAGKRSSTRGSTSPTTARCRASSGPRRSTTRASPGARASSSTEGVLAGFVHDLKHGRRDPEAGADGQRRASGRPRAAGPRLLEPRIAPRHATRSASCSARSTTACSSRA